MKRPGDPPRTLSTIEREWFESELARCAKAHGAAWPHHEAWVRQYLLAELRQGRIRFGTKKPPEGAA
jgi:hypothetical protein